MKLSNKFLYYIGLILVCIYSWDFFSNIIEFSYNLNRFIIFLITLCYSFNFFNCKYTKKEMLILFMLLILVYYSAIKNNELKIYLTYITIISSKNISTRKIIKKFLIINFIMLAVHILLTITGITPEKLSYFTYIDKRARYTFNLRHPNYLAAILFWITSAYIYLNYKKGIFNKLLTINISMILMYLLTFSRTTLVLYILLNFAVIFQKNRKKISLMRTSKILIIIIILFSLYTTWNYQTLILNHKFISKINILLSERLYLSNRIFHYLDLTLLGQNVYALIDNFTIDSLYISFLIQYGLIHFFILILIFIKFPIKEENFMEYMFILIIMVAGISEKYVINIALCFPLLFIKDNMFKKSINNIKE